VLATNISAVLGKGIEWTVTDLIGKESKRLHSQLVVRLAENGCGIEL